MVRFARSLLAVLVCVCLARTASADCGSIPFYAPIMDGVSTSDVESVTSVTFDPLQVSVFEPKQRAIILWNGEEEVLLLSTDQRATRPSSVLEVIPLPNEPKVQLGSFETFQNAQALVVKKGMWSFAHGGAKADLVKQPQAAAGRITFQGKLGAHNLAVAEVLDPNGFVQFVQDYLSKRYKVAKAPIKPEFVKIIESYVRDGYRWFAFDAIRLTEQSQSREPIEYRFKCDHVYYPLRISTLEKGQTEVDLLVFTTDGATKFEAKPGSEIDMTPTMNVTPSEFKEINPKWEGFFKKQIGLKMDRWQIQAESEKLAADVRVK